jgi:superoxide dismutase, Fe-Mn family
MNTPSRLSRRDILKGLGAGAALIGLGSAGARAEPAPPARGAPKPGSPAGGTRQPFSLPKLPYAYGALEPHIDARTMEIHHDLHHKAYIANANKALAAHPELGALTAEEIVADPGALPQAVRETLRNNVGGHVNHAFFWTILSPSGGGEPSGALAAALARDFGSFAGFRAAFTEAAMHRFGSGWAWLGADGAGRLRILSTANQDSPLAEGVAPILGLDVWEHAYYLKHQNRRAEYVEAFWKVANWRRAEQLHAGLAG